MKRSALLLSFMAFGFFTGCQSTDTANGGTKSNVILNSDSSQLSKRMSSDNNGVITINPAPAGKTADASTSLPLIQVSEVLPPVDANGQKLQATHVAVNGNYAYVSYALQGAAYSGAIDVIDVTDPTKPVLLISALVPNTDINAITYSNGKLLMAASTDVDKKVGLKTPAIALDMQLNSGLLTTNCTESDLYGFVTTDIAATTNAYFAVSGDNGKLFKVDNNDQILGSVPVNDLRSVALYQDKIVTLSGTNGVNIFNATDLSVAKSFSTSTDNVQGAKRTIDFFGQNLICSEGSNGIGIYDITSGNKLQSIPLNTSGTTNLADAQTNAVSVNGNYVFAANGDLGLNVFQAGATALTSLGTLNLDGSCNYVKSSGDYIYAANGTGGLKIIKKISSNQSLACDGFTPYPGDAYLNVNSGQTLNYKNDQAVQTVNVNQNLNYCGVLAALQGVTVNSNGVFSLKGGLYVGTTKTASTLIVNGTLIIEGDLMVYGNVILNSGAKLQFLGTGGHMIITGNVTKGSGVTISGNYIDDRNQGKLK